VQYILILAALLAFSACASARSTPALPTADVRRSSVIAVPIVSIATMTPAATWLPPTPEATQPATAIAHQPALGTPLDQYRAWMEEARTVHPYSESVDVM